MVAWQGRCRVGVNWHVACKSTGRAHKFRAGQATNETSSLPAVTPQICFPVNGTNETLLDHVLCHGCYYGCLLIVHVNLIKLINSRCAMRQPQVKQLTAAAAASAAVGHCPGQARPHPAISYDI